MVGNDDLHGAMCNIDCDHLFFLNKQARDRERDASRSRRAFSRSNDYLKCRDDTMEQVRIAL